VLVNDSGSSVLREICILCTPKLPTPIFEVAYPHLLHILKFLNDAKPGTSSQSKASYFSSDNNSVIVNMYRTKASDPDPATPQPGIGETTHPDCRRNIRDSRKVPEDLLLPPRR
jgi:hypothetical protein